MGGKKKNKHRERSARGPQEQSGGGGGGGTAAAGVSDAAADALPDVTELAASVQDSLVKLNAAVRGDAFKATCDAALHSCAVRTRRGTSAGEAGAPSGDRASYEQLHAEYEACVEEALAKAVGEEEMAAVEAALPALIEAVRAGAHQLEEETAVTIEMLGSFTDLTIFKRNVIQRSLALLSNAPPTATPPA